MDIPKCPKTLSGKHYFSEEVEFLRKDKVWIKRPQCCLCRIIDDRKLKVKK